MNQWIIENDVPIPPRNSIRDKRGADGFTEALKALKVGQSLFTREISAATIGGRYTSVTRHWGTKFVTRTMDGGVRVWRVE